MTRVAVVVLPVVALLAACGHSPSSAHPASGATSRRGGGAPAGADPAGLDGAVGGPPAFPEAPQGPPPEAAAADPVVASYRGRTIRASELTATFFDLFRREAYVALSRMIGREIVVKVARQLGIEVPASYLEEEERRIREDLHARAAATYGAGTSAKTYVELELRRDLEEHVQHRLQEARHRWLFNRVIRYQALTRDRVQLDLLVVRDPDLGRELARKLDQGADFRALAREHSVHGSASSGGRMPPLPREALHPAVAGRVFDMQPGDRTGLLEVEDETGRVQYEIVRVVRHLPGREATWEEVRAEIEAGIAEEPVGVAEWTAWYLWLERTYDVELAPDL